MRRSADLSFKVLDHFCQKLGWTCKNVTKDSNFDFIQFSCSKVQKGAGGSKFKFDWPNYCFYWRDFLQKLKMNHYNFKVKIFIFLIRFRKHHLFSLLSALTIHPTSFSSIIVHFRLRTNNHPQDKTIWSVLAKTFSLIIFSHQSMEG